MNVTHQSVSKWENGDSTPDIFTLSALAKFYQIKVDEILNGERELVAVTKNNPILPSNPFLIGRLMISILTFLSLFLFYISESGKLGDYLPLDQYDPWGMKDSIITTDIRGFHLIFNTNRISIYSSGAWIIFLALIGLIGILGICFYFIYIKQKDFYFLKTELYNKLKVILTLSLLLGYLLILIGAIFNIMGDIKINIGLILGLILTLVFFVIDFLEKRYVANQAIKEVVKD
jgi:transcriptional regulator with XRE-family HTH domain